MNYIKNNKNIILLTIILFFSLYLIHTGESTKKRHSKWRYEIHGYVSHNGKKNPAIWFSDTIEIGENYIRYKNSDSSEVVIPSPYVLIDHKYDKVVKDTASTF